MDSAKDVFMLLAYCYCRVLVGQSKRKMLLVVCAILPFQTTHSISPSLTAVLPKVDSTLSATTEGHLTQVPASLPVRRALAKPLGARQVGRSI